MTVAGWRGFLARVSRAWAGRLEAEEIRQVAIAYAWTLPITPVGIAGAIVGVTLEFVGLGKVPSLCAFLVAVTYAALAMRMFLVHHHRAQDLVARRLGLDPRAARRLDFRGYARFDATSATPPPSAPATPPRAPRFPRR